MDDDEFMSRYKTRRMDRGRIEVDLTDDAVNPPGESDRRAIERQVDPSDDGDCIAARYKERRLRCKARGVDENSVYR